MSGAKKNLSLIEKPVHIHCDAGFTVSTSSAGHAGATAGAKLTFDLDHSMWAAQSGSHCSGRWLAERRD